jgi:hypothetical protein
LDSVVLYPLQASWQPKRQPNIVVFMADSQRSLVSTGNYTLTRRQVAKRLGVSTSTVRRMEFVRLNPAPDERGVWRFDPAELDGIEPRIQVAKIRARMSDEELARRREGQLAARVFRMFARGASLAQIVVTMKQPPERIRALYHEWMVSLDEAEWNRGR